MRRAWKLVFVVFALAAPTAGDLGSCGQPVQELDPAIFFAVKGSIDCTKCLGCGFATKRCEEACYGTPSTAFEPNCYPLVHDGEVCLNALRAAGCAEYEAYVDDAAATTPTECNFCPLSERPSTGSGS